MKLISSELFVVSKRMCTFDIRDWIFDIDISKWHMQHMICFITVINCYITTVRGYHRGRGLFYFDWKNSPFRMPLIFLVCLLLSFVLILPFIWGTSKFRKVERHKLNWSTCFQYWQIEQYGSFGYKEKLSNSSYWKG